MPKFGFDFGFGFGQGALSPTTDNKITENGIDNKITESGDNKIMES